MFQNTNPIVEDGPELTEQQLQLLNEAYTSRGVKSARVYHEYKKGRSGAFVYLIEVRDKNIQEVAKFDHPYALQAELDAYRRVVQKGSKQHRTFLEYPPLPSNLDTSVKVPAVPDTYDRKALGVLIYSFQGPNKGKEVYSLKDYYKSHGGEETGKVITKLVENYLGNWWKNVTGTTKSYADKYSQLLPVQAELISAEKRNPLTILESGKFKKADIEQLKPDSYVQLSDFVITSTRDGVLRLYGKSSPSTLDPDIRLKLRPQKDLELASRAWGEMLELQFARVVKTRDELLYEAAKEAGAIFSADIQSIKIREDEYNNPLPLVKEILLQQRGDIKLSEAHGDLNLNNIIVDETGYPFLIDFSDTTSDAATFIDAQRLEEHVVAEILAPEMLEAGLSPKLITNVFTALHDDVHPNSLPDNIKRLKEPYWVLYAIRQLIKPYLTAENDRWNAYYPGLFLVYAGALKYPRDDSQRQLLLIGMTSIVKLGKILPEKKKEETSERRNLMKILIPFLVGLTLGISAFLIFPKNDGNQTSYGSTPEVTPTTPLTETVRVTQTAFVTEMVVLTKTLIITETRKPPTTLERVQTRGYLRCGVTGVVPGLSNEVTNSVKDLDFLIQADKDSPYHYYPEAEGFDADFCRAVAIAIFGTDTNRVVFLNLEAIERFIVMQKPDSERPVDVVFRNTTWTQGRTLEGVVFGSPILYDSAALMYNPVTISRNSTESELQFDTWKNTVSSLKALGGNICVLNNTTTFATLVEEFGRDMLKTEDDIVDSSGELSANEKIFRAYQVGECNFIASDRMQLRGRQKANPVLDGHLIIPTNDDISFEPLAPYIAEGDPQWLNILNHVIWVPMHAIQLDIEQEDLRDFTGRDLTDYETQMNDAITNWANSDESLTELETMRKIEQIRSFLGVDAELSGKSHPLGLQADYALEIIGRIGNYDEIFAKNLGTEPTKGNCVYKPLQTNSNDKCLLIAAPLR